MIGQDELYKRFTYHPPKNSEQAGRYESIRDYAYGMARHIVANSPTSREQSLALTNLELAVMWANAAIARNE